MRKTKKRILAIAAAVPAMPVNPSTAAIRATIRKTSDQRSMTMAFLFWIQDPDATQREPSQPGRAPGPLQNVRSCNDFLTRLLEGFHGSKAGNLHHPARIPCVLHQAVLLSSTGLRGKPEPLWVCKVQLHGRVALRNALGRLREPDDLPDASAGPSLCFCP